MPDDPLANALKRISKLETRNRLRGGFDYPQIAGYWVFNSNSATAGGAFAQSTQTASGGFAMYFAYLPMQNPKLGIRFRYMNASTSTTHWQLDEVVSGITMASGSAAGTSPTTVELHLDISRFFTYGQVAQYNLTSWTSNAANAAQIQAEYIGGSWLPDTAVAV